MNKILQIFSVIAVVLIMVVVIPSDSKSNVVISYNYPAFVGNISPCITYDNSYNFQLRWSTNLNVPKTQAYTNITSVWSSGIYCDDNGNVFWTDTYGNVFSSTFIISIYSYVNSSLIYTWPLPEAEAFTVGSSTVNVNFVTLYLSGSGSIKFSIGTSLWKADVLANTTVSVSSGKLWYNTTIPTISLTGGKTYYLNVYLASGSVQWGYTSSPSSSSKNYVQDYWYYGGTLYNDNSYPNIYTIGYKPTTSITGHDQNYNVPKIVLPLNIKNDAKNVPELFNLSLFLATPATRNIF